MVSNEILMEYQWDLLRFNGISWDLLDNMWGEGRLLSC